ncbi:metallophosphoesterase family protein [Bacillus sp. FJAT-45350]|uniref:metallophosphoesterase family protein n=1 Tax=Bacillus sp. FJAT-45350 TaxID=2011014 RepID=UPI000BB8FC55|nr:metallophosphoesterase [Bacillus sp. FJAT-45350]
MRVLIVSDSHGQTEELSDVITRHRQEVNLIIHCGDSELEANSKELDGVSVVEGNCDYQHDQFPEEIRKELGDYVLYVTHGHHYNVKMTYVPISYKGEEVGANIVCFGHSHVATSFSENGIVYINPGSLRLPRNRSEQTYVICELSTNEVKVSFHERETGALIEELSETFLF